MRRVKKLLFCSLTVVTISAAASACASTSGGTGKQPEFPEETETEIATESEMQTDEVKTKYTIPSDTAEEIRKMLKSGDFEEIKELLCNTDIPEEEYNLIDDVINIKDNFYYEKDDFEEKSWIFDATNYYIYRENALVPYIFLGNGVIRCKVGFVADSWLFFRKTKIKFDDGEIVERSYDAYNEIKTEVLSRGSVFEQADIEITYDELQRFSESDNLTIRFLSKDGGYMDFAITTDSFRLIKTVKDAYDQISDIVNYY